VSGNAGNDLVLTAIGDCGSCCSSCIRDAVALEKLGIPSVAIVSDVASVKVNLLKAKTPQRRYKSTPLTMFPDAV
jgi:hypothetical protein